MREPDARRMLAAGSKPRTQDDRPPQFPHPIFSALSGVARCRRQTHFSASLASLMPRGMRSYQRKAIWFWNFGVRGLDHNKPSHVHYPDAKHPYPKRGDIFHINQPKTNRDHVGIILNLVCVDADDDAWTIEAVEGGQQEFWTRHFASKSMIKSGQNRVFSGGDRPIQGLVDIDKYGSWVDF